MYHYTDFDRQFVLNRAAQYRDQLERNLRGELSDDDFRPLRLQNGWYVERYAPMLRVAAPYGELSSAQLRVLARIAREYDQPDAQVYQRAQTTQAKLGTLTLPTGYAHFSTRQNVQFNWIPLDKSADVMDLLASENMHGIQTSGSCVRSITSDERAGIAVDEMVDPRPFCEIIRQWSLLHPEFAFLPRKFKIAVSGAREDRTASAWHDVGLRLLRDIDGKYSPDGSQGAVGFRVLVGGGMGRTPMIASTIRDFLPWDQILNYLEAILRVYNRWGRRDNLYKARIKILVKAEGQRFSDEVEAEFRQIIELDGARHTITQQELDRVSASFVPPALSADKLAASLKVASILRATVEDDAEFGRWLNAERRSPQEPRIARRDPVVQAPGPRAGRRNRQSARCCGAVGRSFLSRGGACHARSKPVVAVGALRPVA